MRTRHVVESPIEAMLLAAFYRVIRSGGGIEISTQYEVKTVAGLFRLDLALKFEDRQLAVECDGADWHTSPEQRERDAARDDALAAVGWRVVRFSGAEIVRDAEDCATKAVTALLEVHAPAATARRSPRRVALPAPALDTIEQVVAEQGRLYAEMALQGSPVPDELLLRAQVAARRRSALERQRDPAAAAP